MHIIFTLSDIFKEIYYKKLVQYTFDKYIILKRLFIVIRRDES